MFLPAIALAAFIGQTDGSAHLQVHPTFRVDLIKKHGLVPLRGAQVHPNYTIVQKQNIGLKLGSFTFDSKPEYDLRPVIEQNHLKIKDQGSRGTCSVFAMTFLLEYNFAKFRPTMAQPLSEEFLNWASNNAIGQYFDGGFFSDMVLGYEKSGISTGSDCPYLSSFNPNFKPSTKAKTEAKTREGKQQFLVVQPGGSAAGLKPGVLGKIEDLVEAGFPVAVGQRWPEYSNNIAFKKILGVDTIVMPSNAAVLNAAHSMAIVGFKRSSAFPGGGYFVFRNSWGEENGDKGYLYISYDYVKKNSHDAYVAWPLPAIAN